MTNTDWRTKMIWRFLSATCSLRRPTVLVVILVTASAVRQQSRADEPTVAASERRFSEVVLPFVKNYCLQCHRGDQPKARLDLSRYTSGASILKNHRVWDRIVERLEAQEMPPEKAIRQPT